MLSQASVSHSCICFHPRGLRWALRAEGCRVTDGDTHIRGEEGIRGGRAGQQGQERLEDWTCQITGSPLV